MPEPSIPGLDIDLAASEQCALFDLQRASRALTVMYNLRLRDTGLTIAQFTLLRNISFLAPARYTRIAEAMLMDRTSVTRLLEPLLEKHYLKIVPEEEDRRAKSVTVTKLGLKALATSDSAWRTAQRDLQTIVGSAKLLEMRRVLRDVVHLVRESESGGRYQATDA